MAGFDEGNVFVGNQGATRAPVAIDLYKPNFAKFIREFRKGNLFVYRDQLRRNVNLRNYHLTVHLEDLVSFDEDLATNLMQNPTELLPTFAEAAGEAAALELDETSATAAPRDRTRRLADEPIQIMLETSQNVLPLRSLMSTHISRLVAVSGIVISASRKHAKANRVVAQCRSCGTTKQISCKPGFGGIDVPRHCDQSNATAKPGQGSTKLDACPMDPFSIVADKSTFVDQQTLKLQEDPESIPTAEMPRQLLLSVDRYLVNKAVPGTRVTVVGIYTTIHQSSKSDRRIGGSSIQQPYVRVVGIQLEGAGRMHTHFRPEEEQMFLQWSREPDLVERLRDSLAPAIYGHDDIKKAVLCQLFGGSRKTLPDGMRLRGDINILLLGDPGTAKSQLLKFIEKVAPIGVYTSGKGSSAAGLTASVVKDKSTREFYLEGGAMVLADGGVVCIDEFDKMRVQDRVAIHEAMEQQTISIAKAGITTILNSRTSVLAAANPAFGRYDELRSAADNIDFQSTILSRFDLIFLVKDALNEASDRRVAGHVLDLHMRRSTQRPESEVQLNHLKRYISFCKMNCGPRLSPAAAEVLQNHYVSVRAGVRARSVEMGTPTIPITVRQLEAIVRISEALAKITLSPVATEQHVNEAIRLFKVSTLEAATAGAVAAESISPELMAEVNNAEQLLKRRLPIGSTISEKHVVDDFIKQGISEFSIRKAIHIMIQRNELEYRKQRHSIYRKM